MKIILKRYYILIVSPRFVDFLANFKNIGRKPMGFTVFPFFIFLRDLENPMTNVWINHERIHIAQDIESLGVAMIVSFFENIYARLILRYDNTNAYFYECMEQEAYLNQEDQEYISKRKPYSIFKYIQKKRDFYLNDEHRVVLK